MLVSQPLEAAIMVTSSRQQVGDGHGRGCQGQEKSHCDYCGIPRHIQENCYKLHDYSNKGSLKEKAVEKFVVNNSSQKGSATTTINNHVVPHLTPEQ